MNSVPRGGCKRSAWHSPTTDDLASKCSKAQHLAYDLVLCVCSAVFLKSNFLSCSQQDSSGYKPFIFPVCLQKFSQFLNNDAKQINKNKQVAGVGTPRNSRAALPDQHHAFGIWKNAHQLEPGVKITFLLSGTAASGSQAHWAPGCHC